MKCNHDERAVCWLCSDQQPWWRDARIKAGIGGEPPNAPEPPEEDVWLRVILDATWQELRGYQQEFLVRVVSAGEAGIESYDVTDWSPIQSLRALERRGLVTQRGHWSLWYATEAGRRMVAQNAVAHA